MVMNCKYCNRLFQPRLPNQVTCGETECKRRLGIENTKKWAEKVRLIKQKEKEENEALYLQKMQTGIKPENVCKGCKYGKKFREYTICNYSEMEGHSRLLVEQNNGGYRTDTCICYKK